MDLNNAFQQKPPRKILSIVVAFAGVMLVLWLLFVIRMGGSQAPAPIPENDIDRERLESVRSLRGEMDAIPEQERRENNIVGNGVMTFFVLAVLIGGAWLWVARKGGPLEPETGSAPFTELGKHSIAPGQHLQIVEVNNEIWVLGVTGASINLLHRYDRDEWDGPVQPASAATSKTSFLEIFKGKQS